MFRFDHRHHKLEQRIEEKINETSTASTSSYKSDSFDDKKNPSSKTAEKQLVDNSDKQKQNKKNIPDNRRKLQPSTKYHMKQENV